MEEAAAKDKEGDKTAEQSAIALKDIKDDDIKEVKGADHGDNEQKPDHNASEPSVRNEDGHVNIIKEGGEQEEGGAEEVSII